MKTTITAKGSFAHGSRTYAEGESLSVTKGEADELIKAGLAEEAGEQEGAAEVDQKADTAIENKMEDAPANKSTKRK